MNNLEEVAKINQDLSKLTCKNLIDLFNKMGGHIECNYGKNTCCLKTKDNMSITLNIKRDDDKHIEKLVWDHQANPYIKYNKNEKNDFIKKIHNYQEEEYSFSIEGKIDKNCMWNFV